MCEASLFYVRLSWKVLPEGFPFPGHSLYSLVVLGGDPCYKNPPASIEIHHPFIPCTHTNLIPVPSYF